MERFTWLSFFILACIALNAQQSQSHRFEEGVAGVEFSDLSIVDIVARDGGTRIFLELERTGAIQKVNGSISSGGKDPVRVKALGIIDFSPAMEVEQESLHWIKPDGITFKNYNILAKPGDVLGEVLATQDDCHTILELAGKYPDILRAHLGEKAEADTYYKNYITYSLLGGKPQKLEINLIEIDQEGEKSRSEKDIPLEGYRNSSKNDYWYSAVESQCDPASGLVWAYHVRKIVGEYRNQSNLFFQEVSTFDKDGQLKNRTDIEFGLPHLLEYSQYFYREGKGGRNTIAGKAHMYKQAYGFGYKKLNPEPDKLSRWYYEWDASGKLLAKTQFQSPAESLSPVFISKGKERSFVLAYSLGERGFYLLQFSGGQLSVAEKLEEEHPLAKGLAGMESTLARGDNRLLGISSAASGDVYIYELKTSVSQGVGKNDIIKNVANILFFTDKEGAIRATAALPTPEGAPDARFRVYPAKQGRVVVLNRGAGFLQVFHLGDDGVMKELYASGPDDRSPSASYLRENDQLAVSGLTADGKLEIQLISLK